MKKIFSMTLLSAAALAFTGCAGEEDDIFSSSAANRLDQSKVTYTERLKSAADGWANTLEDLQGGRDLGWAALPAKGYLLLMDFNSDESVRMAMDNDFSNDQYIEDVSAWQVITDNGPVLTFNTYNDCIHAFSDPKGNPAFDNYPIDQPTGRGAEGDYEFVIIDLPENGEFAMLKGKKRGTYIRMTRLDEGTDFHTYMDDVQGFRSKMFSPSAPNECVVTLGDSVMGMADADTIPNLYPYGGDPVADCHRCPYLVTKRGGKYYFRFKDALTAPDGTAAQEFVYDEERDLFTGVDNPEFTIEGENPTTFFIKVGEERKGWRFNNTMDMSDDIRTAYSKLSAAFNAVLFSLDGIIWKYENGKAICTINFTDDVWASNTVSYYFTLNKTDKGCTLTYDGPVDSSGESTINYFPAIKNMLDAFNADYTVESVTTNFDLTNIRFASESGKEFVVTYIN